MNDVLLKMNSQHVTLIVLLDLSAAFNTIAHNILLKRLHRFGHQLLGMVNYACAFSQCSKCLRWPTSASTQVRPVLTLVVASSPTSLAVESNHVHPVRQLLHCAVQLYNHCICFSSHIVGPYLSVFSSSFLALLLIHGQLISSVQTSFLSWLTSRA